MSHAIWDISKNNGKIVHVSFERVFNFQLWLLFCENLRNMEARFAWLMSWPLSPSASGQLANSIICWNCKKNKFYLLHSISLNSRDHIVSGQYTGVFYSTLCHHPPLSLPCRPSLLPWLFHEFSFSFFKRWCHSHFICCKRSFLCSALCAVWNGFDFNRSISQKARITEKNNNKWNGPSVHVFYFLGNIIKDRERVRE